MSNMGRVGRAWCDFGLRGRSGADWQTPGGEAEWINICNFTLLYGASHLRVLQLHCMKAVSSVLPFASAEHLQLTVPDKSGKE